MQDVAANVLAMAKEQGFALAGIAPAEPSAHGQEVRQWVADGKHGTMGYLENNLEVRLDPGLLLDGAKSVIAVADAYVGEAASRSEQEATGDDAAARGKVARYAHGADYHKTLKKRLHLLADALAELHPGESFRTTVDTAPALERELAQAAGLGWQAKNTMLIHPRHGSYTLLGLIVTTMALEGAGDGEDATGSEASCGEAEPGGRRPLATHLDTRLVTDHCANCTRCIDACPTDAIAAEGYSIDASRCVSYLTLEHRETIDVSLHEGIGDWLAGCDICQEVCPYNVIGGRNPLQMHERYTPRPEMAKGLDLIELLSWTAEDRARVFQGSALKRIKLDMVRRNALIVVGNVLVERDNQALRDAVAGCLDDESDLVKETATQVWRRLEDV